MPRLPQAAGAFSLLAISCSRCRRARQRAVRLQPQGPGLCTSASSIAGKAPPSRGWSATLRLEVNRFAPTTRVPGLRRGGLYQRSPLGGAGPILLRRNSSLDRDRLETSMRAFRWTQVRNPRRGAFALGASAWETPVRVAAGPAINSRGVGSRRLPGNWPGGIWGRAGQPAVALPEPSRMKAADAEFGRHRSRRR
jgi:hypothetical protein